MKRLFAGCLLAAVVSGCASFDAAKDENAEAKIVITKTTATITIDGVLSEEAWKNAQVYELSRSDNFAAMFPLEREKALRDKFEGARVRLLYDDKYLYVGAEFDDEDLLDFVKEDQYHCYRNADTFELFLSPENALHYWEIYSTPAGNKTGFFFPAGGMLPMEELLKFSTIMNGLTTASKIQGTLNNAKDKDKGWTTELRISRAELASKGVEFGPGQAWKILLARYNYSHFLYRFQNSTYPLLPGASFHLRSYYAPVEFK